jgi:hypothetical protein
VGTFFLELVRFVYPFHESGVLRTLFGDSWDDIGFLSNQLVSLVRSLHEGDAPWFIAKLSLPKDAAPWTIVKLSLPKSGADLLRGIGSLNLVTLLGVRPGRALFIVTLLGFKPG